MRREAALMAQHPENDAIDDWIEMVKIGRVEVMSYPTHLAPGA
jgi:hypothetical protein